MAERREPRDALAIGTSVDVFTNDKKLWTLQHQQPQINRMRKQIHFSLTSNPRKINLSRVRLCILFIFGAYLYLAVQMFQSPIEVPVRRQNASLQEQPQQDSIMKNSMMNMDAARLHTLAPLEALDYHQYTIRMNTWRRNEQLLLSVNHYTRCEGVAQIQVIWCDSENEPPLEVFNHPSGKVVVERHELDSLNERFHIFITYTDIRDTKHG